MIEICIFVSIWFILGVLGKYIGIGFAALFLDVQEYHIMRPINRNYPRLRWYLRCLILGPFMAILVYDTLEVIMYAMDGSYLRKVD